MAQPDRIEAEAPEADAAEQARNVDPEEYEGAPSQSLEAPEWDAQEQTRPVPMEDDYR